MEKTEVNQECKVCKKWYSADYRAWYDKYTAWACSSACFARILSEAYAPLPVLTEDKRITEFKHSDRSYRSDYERDFDAWLHKVGLVHQYEPYTFTFNMKHRYVPDFYIMDRVFVEVKGIWNSEGKKKFLSMTKEFSEIPILVVDKKFLDMLKRTSK